MKPFESIFEELRGSIISSEMELLYPAKNALLLPAMSTKNNNHIMNKCFRKSLKNKIVSAFNKDNNYNIGAIEVITEETEKQFILKLHTELIRALFVLLDKAIRRDDGLLQSNHWKEYPVTMWIEEAILVPEIYNLKKLIVAA